MTAVDLLVEELRQRLAQVPLQGQSAAGPETLYHELISFVPPWTDLCDDATLESRRECMRETMRLLELTP